MVFLIWVHSDSICPFVRVTILMFHHEFSFILTSYPIHQNVHLVLFSKYIQSLTPLATSTSQEVFSWKLTLGWSQAEARWSGVCSWEYLWKEGNSLGRGRGAAGVLSQRRPELTEAPRRALSWDSPWEPCWTEVRSQVIRPSTHTSLDTGYPRKAGGHWIKQLSSEEATLQEEWQAKAISWRPPSCWRNKYVISEGELGRVPHAQCTLPCLSWSETPTSHD